MNTLTAGLAISNRALIAEVLEALRGLPVRVLVEQPASTPTDALVDTIRRLRPEIMLVELAPGSEPVEDRLRALGAAPGQPQIIAIQAAPDPEAIVAAMRGGATEYLYPPFGERFRLALERLSSGRGAKAGATASGRAIAFLSAKGGCGATSLVCHLAREFQRQTSDKILLADFDMDAGIVRFLLKTKSQYSVLDAAASLDRLDPSFWKALISNGTPRLEVIAARPVEAAANDPVPERDSLRAVARFARPFYDWLLLDLGRGFNPTSMSVLEEVDDLFLITTPAVSALYQAKQMIQALTAGGYPRKRLHVVLNRFHKSAQITTDGIQTILGVPLYATVSEHDAALEEAYADGSLASPSSAPGVEFSRLAAKILGVPAAEEMTKRRFSIFGGQLWPLGHWQNSRT